MAGKIAVYNLGQLGVDVVKSPVHIDDGAFTKAQNAQIDSVQGVGGIRKRDGITRLNGSALAGAVRGIIGLPLPNQGTLTRYLMAPIDDHGGGASGSWRTSTNGTVWATAVAAGPPVVVSSLSAAMMAGSTSIFVPLLGMPWIALNNVIYYPSNDFTVGTDDPPLHVWDGTSDYKFLTIPNSQFQVAARVGMITSIQPYDENTMLVGTYDDNNFGRVLLLDIRTGALSTLGFQSDMTTFAAFPGTPIVFAGKVFFSTVNTGGGTVGKVFWARPGDATWTRETAGDTNNLIGHNVGAAVFKSNLYFGNIAEVGGNSRIYKRSPSGVYTVARTNSSAALGNTEGPFIVSPDGTTMWCWENVTGGTRASSTVNLQRVLETTDGVTFTQVFDVGANVNNGYTVAGYPCFDTNGDLYWCILDPGAAAPAFTSLIIRRTAAGSWSVVDNNAAKLRGPMMKMKY